jgi:hypothetical protein
MTAGIVLTAFGAFVGLNLLGLGIENHIDMLAKQLLFGGDGEKP